MSATNLAPDWGQSYGIREMWSEIAPGLFQGGTADHDVIGQAVAWERQAHRAVLDSAAGAVITLDDFDAVITAYAFARPVDWEVEELRWGFMDSEADPVDMDTLRETVVWGHRRWKGGKRVLVRCQAGLNRSGLITGGILIRDGMEPQDAIDKIRRCRAGRALFNDHFVSILLTTPVEYWRN
jgi:hypothetical protein